MKTRQLIVINGEDKTKLSLLFCMILLYPNGVSSETLSIKLQMDLNITNELVKGLMDNDIQYNGKAYRVIASPRTTDSLATGNRINLWKAEQMTNN